MTKKGSRAGRNSLSRQRAQRGTKAETRKRNRSTVSSKPAGRSRLTARKTARRALDAVAKMRREKKSLSRAARSAHTTRETVRKYAKGAVVPTAHGRYKARGYDRLTREMRFLTPEDLIAIPVRSSASASRIGQYFAAVKRYADTGQTDRLERFNGRTVEAKGVRYRFVTDLDVLDRLLNAGVVSFEDIYTLTV